MIKQNTRRDNNKTAWIGPTVATATDDDDDDDNDDDDDAPVRHVTDGVTDKVETRK